MLPRTTEPPITRRDKTRGPERVGGVRVEWRSLRDLDLGLAHIQLLNAKITMEARLET